MFGFINISKPKNITSHDVVSYLRKITKIKQIGHTGTLDPFAEGVLPVAIGKATRLIEYIDDEKEYCAEVSFGKNTDTYDLDGTVTESFNKKISKEELETALENFKGEIEQVPPMYSAIKVQGKKLYEYAREGKTVDISPRKVFIEKLELRSFDEQAQKAELVIKCSKGTYIRSIAFDIGKTLNCGGYLSKLVRTQAGKFFLNESVNLYDIKSLEDVNTRLIAPPLNLPEYVLNDIEAQKIKFGQTIQSPKPLNNEKFVLTHNSKIIAIASSTSNTIKAEKVFNYD